MTRRSPARWAIGILASVWLWPALGIVAVALAGWLYGRSVALAVSACVVALGIGTALGLLAAIRPTIRQSVPGTLSSSSRADTGRSTNLQGANLRDAILCHANLRQADLRGAELAGANLQGADLSGANLAPMPERSGEQAR